MLLFDIGANAGEATLAGLNKGYRVIALEPAPKVFKDLVCNFIYNPGVIPLKMCVSDKDDQDIYFYECIENGLSSLEKNWFTDPSMPYYGKEFRTIKTTTITIYTLIKLYGTPDIIKIDVEGAEWAVFKGMSKYSGILTFEWTNKTIEEHQKQIHYLKNLGYTKIGPQFIEHHLQEPVEWFDIDSFEMFKWINLNKNEWINGKWKLSNLRPTADVGMIWVK